MPSSADRDHEAFMARTARWINAYFLVALAVTIVVAVTKNPMALAILAGAILVLERMRRAREWDLRNQDGGRSAARKVRFAAKSRRE